MTWTQVDDRPLRAPGSAAVVWLLGAVPLAVHVAGRGDHLVALAVVAVSAVALAAVRRGPTSAGPVAAVATGIVALIAGPSAAVVGVAASVGWSWVVGLVPPRGRTPDPAHARPALGPLAVGSATLALGDRLVLPAALIGGGLALALLADRYPGATRRATALADRVGAAIAAVVRAVLVVPVVALTSVAWAIHRLIRHDPMAPPSGPSRWVERRSGDRTPDRLYSSALLVPTRTPVIVLQRAVLRIGGIVATVALTLGLVAVAHDGDLSRTPLLAPQAERVLGEGAQALEDVPGWTEVVDETYAFLDGARFDPVTTYSFADHRGDAVNQVDGTRATWRPPPCTCRRVAVWLFGGSAAWGYYQRDDETPASHLARAAWERGIALDVTTFALPAMMMGQQARLFGHLVTSRPPPDVALFYDGANEVAQQNERHLRGEGADGSEMVERTVAARIDAAFSPPAYDLLARIGDQDGGGSPGGATSVAELGRLAVERYARSVELVQRIADGVGVATVFTWQPIASTAPPSVSAPGAHRTEVTRAFWNTMYDEARAGLPASVVDLSDVLDTAGPLVFADIFHTDEQGAEIVGRALETELHPLIEDLSAG